jgi:hypothetical protein
MTFFWVWKFQVSVQLRLPNFILYFNNILTNFNIQITQRIYLNTSQASFFTPLSSVLRIGFCIRSCKNQTNTRLAYCLAHIKSKILVKLKHNRSYYWSRNYISFRSTWVHPGFCMGFVYTLLWLIIWTHVGDTSFPMKNENCIEMRWIEKSSAWVMENEKSSFRFVKDWFLPSQQTEVTILKLHRTQIIHDSQDADHG